MSTTLNHIGLSIYLKLANYTEYQFTRNWQTQYMFQRNNNNNRLADGHKCASKIEQKGSIHFDQITVIKDVLNVKLLIISTKVKTLTLV